MIDEQLLRTGLQKLLKETESAIRERLEDEPSLQAQLKERHDAAVRAERTEGSKKGFLAFSDEAITQAAVHWLLGCVFVRFLEDNGWLDERNGKAAWISGPGERLAIAKDRRTLYLRPDPSLTDRDYLLHVFAEVAKLPGVAGLFDPKHNPLYSLQPTAQGASKRGWQPSTILPPMRCKGTWGSRARSDRASSSIPMDCSMMTSRAST